MIAFIAQARQCGRVNEILKIMQRQSGWVAIVVGAISATSFAPLGLWPMMILALAALLHLVAIAPDKKQALRTGYLFGLGHFAVALNWVAGSFRYQEAMPVWLGWIAVLVLALYLAVYPALAAMSAWWIGDAVRRKGRKSTIPYILAFAGAWIITEWLRSWVFTGFAWNPISVTQLSWIGAWALPVIGTYGVSGLVILQAAIVWGLLAALIAKQQAGKGKAIFARMLDFAILSFLCWLASLSVTPLPKPAAPMPMIAIVQPNIGQQDKYASGFDDLNFAKLAVLSRPLKGRPLKGQGPRLLLWPEAAIPDYLEDGYPYRFYQYQYGESATGAREHLAKLMGTGDVLLTGANRLVIDKDGQMIAARNSMIAMDASGKLLGFYNKSHLVPYGEYLALRWLLEPLGATRLVPGDVDFLPGPGPATLEFPHFGKVGIQICYEIIFSGQVVDAHHRPDFLFNPSNDAWFGTWGPPQFLAQAQLRAIEEGLPVVRSTPTGISALIGADGRIVKSIALGHAGRIDSNLPVAYAPTLFARNGNSLPLGFAALILALAFLPVVRRTSSR